MNRAALPSLALALSGILMPRDAHCAPTGKDGKFESLCAKVFPEKKYYQLQAVDFKNLPPAECDAIALAAARELSPIAPDGTLITNERIAAAYASSENKETLPARLDYRRLIQGTEQRIDLLRELAEANLIHTPEVIAPLIGMLDYPILRDASHVQTTLHALTLRNPEDKPWLNPAINEENQSVIAAWWREWWAKNRDLHPLFDEELERIVLARMLAIEKRILLGLGRDYGELRNLHLARSKITRFDSQFIAEASVDSSNLWGEALIRIQPDGSIRNAEATYLLVSAGFTTPPPLPVKTTHRGGIPENWGPLRGKGKINVAEVYRELLPGTDIVFTVHAASEDNVFPQAVREVMNKPPEWTAQEISRLSSNLRSSPHAYFEAGILAQIGEYDALLPGFENPSPEVRESTATALGSGFPLSNPGLAKIIPPLLEMLKSSEAHTRYIAAWALGNVAGKAQGQYEIIVPALLAAAKDNDKQVRASARNALDNLATSPNPWLDEAARKAIRKAAANVAKKTGS